MCCLAEAIQNEIYHVVSNPKLSAHMIKAKAEIVFCFNYRKNRGEYKIKQSLSHPRIK
jgi:hypothetical protein